MKKIIIFTCLCIAVIFVSSCSKDKAKSPATPGVPPPGNSGYFFENTEWTGVAATYGQEYPQPCYLRFNGDTTVSVYVLFAWIMDNVNLEYHDSTVGHITSIDTVTDGMITIQVTFPFTSDQQVYHITDKKTLYGSPSPTSTVFYYNAFSPSLELCPKNIPSVSGTNWATNKITGSGPAEGMYEYPDITTFGFSVDGFTSYVRNGKIITYTPPDQTDLLLYKYSQIGPRLYFAGYNETTDKLIVYYGVLSPDGNTILADCRNHTDTRLPNYVQTINWYGPSGTTPNTHRVN